MKVKDLRERIKDADDDLEVFVLLDDAFCPVEEIDVIQVGDACDENGGVLENTDDYPDEFEVLMIQVNRFDKELN